MQRLTYKIVLRSDRPKPDGRQNLILTAFLNGVRVRINLNVAVDPNNYDPIRMIMRPKGDRAQAERVNTLLAQIKSRVEELFFDALITQKTLTAERFEQMFDKGAPAGDFLAFMMAEIDEVKGTQATGTVKAWMSTYNHLKRYQPKIGFGDITLEFVKGFDAYLQRQKFDQNYIVKHHRFIRKFVLLANKRGKRIPNPYNEFKIREVQKERDYLTGQEVKILRELYESRQLKPHLQVTLRHFLFQIGTSLRYSDLAVMTKENVVNGLLVFCPVKTARVGRLVKCPLSEMALQMLQDSESTGQKLFMVPAEQTMNRWLKEIAEFAGISKRLTTHMGRHTYGFLFIASGGQVEVLQKIMGHADLKTTQIYTHIDNSQIVDGVEQINRFLNTVMVE